MAAYIVSVCHITNMNDNMKKYAVASAELIHKHGGRYLMKGVSQDIASGEALEGRYTLVVEFPSMDNIKSFFFGDEYQQKVKPLREGTGTYDIAFYEGLPPEEQ